jgi:hypothetical protein
MRAKITAVVMVLAGAALAQAPAAYRPKPAGNLKQVMRSVPLPQSNIIFDAQTKAPADEMAWKDVENAAIAIGETANLIMIPGRLLSSGRPVPLQNADFVKFAQALVPAGQACYKAAQMKSQDGITNCADTLTEACANCHDVYRDRPQPAPAKPAQGKGGKKE